MSADDKSTRMYVETTSRDGLVASQMLEKTDTPNEDVALRIFSNVHAIADDIDPHAEKRLVRKIDCFIMPFICITYLITYIDKATLSYGTAQLFAINHSC
jgi:hypothetical protein